jgi:hypothetical protein
MRRARTIDRLPRRTHLRREVVPQQPKDQLGEIAAGVCIPRVTREAVG